MKHHTVLTPICVVAMFAFNIGTVEATEVNCNDGETIAGALQHKGKAISIKGTCIESPELTADDITLQGVPGFSPTVFGSITVDGAQRFHIEGITVTGSTDIGIRVINGATATIVDNMIKANTSTGISVLFGSSAVLTGNTIIGNGESGMNVSFNSQANLRGGNTVYGNFEEGIFVSKASSFSSGMPPYTGLNKDTFTDNEPGIAPIHVKESSNASIRDSDITCIASCSNAIESIFGATVRAENNTQIMGNISAFHGGVRVRKAQFFGTLNCGSGGYAYGHVACGQTCDGNVPGTCYYP